VDDDDRAIAAPGHFAPHGGARQSTLSINTSG